MLGPVLGPTLYRAARPLIYNGDVLLFKSPASPIAILGRGQYSHAAIAFWHGALNSNQRVLMLAEFREFKGGRIVTLSSQVRDYPGRIDVFRPNCSPHIAAFAAELMVRQAGHAYGWPSIYKCAALHAPGIRWAASRWWNVADTTLSPWDAMKHCSQGVCWTFRKAARSHRDTFDLVPGLADWAVEPTHLEHSAGLDLVHRGLVHALPAPSTPLPKTILPFEPPQVSA